MPRLPPLLRGSLVSTPGPTGSTIGSFALPCRKLIIGYNDTWPSSQGAKEFVDEQAAKVAERWPSVEVVVMEQPNRHPIARGLYNNDREKVISLRNLSSLGVAEKVMLLLESSGRKVVNLRRKPVVAGASESARGMWSALHGARKEHHK